MTNALDRRLARLEDSHKPPVEAFRVLTRSADMTDIEAEAWEAEHFGPLVPGRLDVVILRFGDGAG